MRWAIYLCYYVLIGYNQTSPSDFWRAYLLRRERAKNGIRIKRIYTGENHINPLNLRSVLTRHSDFHGLPGQQFPVIFLLDPH